MIVVDTDVLIAHLRGVDAAATWLRDSRAAGRRLAVSALTVTELVGGMRSPERREVTALLRRRYRRSHATISTVDYVIAATAERHGAELATLSVRHFPMVDGLRPPFTV